MEQSARADAETTDVEVVVVVEDVVVVVVLGLVDVSSLVQVAVADEVWR